MGRCDWQIDNEVKRYHYTHTPNLRRMIRRKHARIERHEVKRYLSHEEWEEAMNMDRKHKRFNGYQGGER